MKIDQNITQMQLENMERYLQGNLNPEERGDFEKSLQKDPDMRYKLEELRTILVGVETASLKDKLEEYHLEMGVSESRENIKPISPGTKNTKLLWYSIAASIIVILGVLWILGQKTTPEKLFASHFVADPGLPTTMGTTTDYNFYDGMVNYKRKEYDKAIEKWDAIEPKNDTLNYFLGVAYLVEGSEKLAVHYLERVASVSSSVFLDDSNYYLGLAFLKENNNDKAKTYLLKSNSEEAKEILAELDN